MAKSSKMKTRARKGSVAQKKKTQRSSAGRKNPETLVRRKAKAPGRRQPGSEPRVQPKPVGTRFTFHVNSTLTLACVPDDTPALFSLDAAASLTGVHAEMLRYYCRAGLVDSRHGTADSEPLFEENALNEVRRIEHYRRHLAVSRHALPLICELRREAERQHIEIQFLRYP